MFKAFSLKTFKPLRITLIFLSGILLYVLIIFIFFVSTSTTDIINHSVNNSGLGLVYDQNPYLVETEEVKYINNEYSFSDSKHYRMQITDKSYKYGVPITSNVDVPSKIVVSDYIYLNGSKKKIDDNVVYISDFMYDLVTVYTHVRFRVETTTGSIAVDFPLVEPNNRKNNLHITLLDIYGINYKVKVYETDYRKHLPLLNENGEILYTNENLALMSKFYDNFVKYYGLAYVNKNMAVYFLNTFNNLPIDPANDAEAMNEVIACECYYFPVDDYYIVLASFPNNALADNTFTCNYLYASKYLGVTNYEEVNGLKIPIYDKLEYYQFAFGDYYFKAFDPRMISKGIITPIYGNDVPILFLNKQNMSIIFEELGCDSFDYYELDGSLNVLSIDMENIEDFDFMYKEEAISFINNNSQFKAISITVMAVSLTLLIALVSTYSFVLLRKDGLLEYGNSSSIAKKYGVELILFSLIIIGSILAAIFTCNSWLNLFILMA